MKDKRIEHRGYGEIKIHKSDSFKTIKTFVENEPDNLLALAIIVKAENRNFDIVFTDRHSINYDVTSMTNSNDNIDEILILCPSIDKDENYIPLSNHKGHYYYVEIYTYKNMKVVTERANIQALENRAKYNLNRIYEMVFHPNGLLCAGWDETKDIIDVNLL